MHVCVHACVHVHTAQGTCGFQMTTLLMCSHSTCTMQAHISHDNWYKSLTRPDESISIMDREELMSPYPELRNCELSVTFQEREFSSGTWPMVGCPCSRGLPNTYAYPDSIDWAQQFNRKKEEMKMVEIVLGGGCGRHRGVGGREWRVYVI